MSEYWQDWWLVAIGPAVGAVVLALPGKARSLLKKTRRRLRRRFASAAPDLESAAYGVYITAVKNGVIHPLPLVPFADGSGVFAIPTHGSCNISRGWLAQVRTLLSRELHAMGLAGPAVGHVAENWPSKLLDLAHRDPYRFVMGLEENGVDCELLREHHPFRGAPPSPPKLEEES